MHRGKEAVKTERKTEVSQITLEDAGAYQKLENVRQKFP